MVSEALLNRVQIPQENIHRIEVERGVSEAAADYDRKITDIFQLRKRQAPSFDLILLGLGEDGHTASLFPNTSALKNKDRLVIESWVKKLNEFRITLTPKALCNSDNIFFIATGDKKASAVKQVIQGENKPYKYPAQLIVPINGNLYWMLDEAASKLLS